MIATATGWPVSSSWTLKIGPTTAMPSKVRRRFRPFSPMPNMVVFTPSVAAKTPGVRCHGSKRNSLPSCLGISISLVLPPQIGTTDTLPSARRIKCVSAAMKEPLRRPTPTTCGKSTFFNTFPLAASKWSETAPEPSALAARTQMALLSSGEVAAAQKSALALAWLGEADHSCLPAIVRASTSPSRTMMTFCLAPESESSKSTTASEYSRCQVRSPVVLFQNWTIPLSVTLINPRLAARSMRIPPCAVATLRHCMVPSFSSTDATAPDADATKRRSDASAAYARAVGFPICCNCHSYCPTSSSNRPTTVDS
mmetsp:Transcript_126151/g.315324  ORF Transcript_126151/g.315324 Transcript_126151/m.315324 type:complete len:311 (-) Transcript_126151:148-1080(-)